jgi:hypothetical protein
MIRRIVRTAAFAARSFALAALAGAVLVGVSCYRHGDVGPYPELDYLPWLPVAAMLVAYAAD